MIAHQHSVQVHTQEALDEKGGALAGVDEVGQRSDHGILAKLRAILEKPRGCRGQSDALALESFQRVHLSLECRYALLRASEIGASTWAQFFIKFVAAHPAVTVVTPATSQARHMVDNLGAAVGPLPDEAMRRRMIQHVDGLPAA